MSLTDAFCIPLLTQKGDSGFVVLVKIVHGLPFNEFNFNGRFKDNEFAFRFVLSVPSDIVTDDIIFTPSLCIWAEGFLFSTGIAIKQTITLVSYDSQNLSLPFD